MNKTRLCIRLDKQLKAKAKVASVLLGYKSLTDYVACLIIESSTKTIDSSESIMVENDIFDRFLSACKSVGEPGSELMSAVQFSKDQGFM